MAETFPTPAALSTTAADALSGTTHERTQMNYLAKGTSPTSTPTLAQQYFRLERQVRQLLSMCAAGMCRKTDTLEVGAAPFRYRKSDGTDAHFEGGTLALTASNTNYVYLLHSTNALTKSTTSFPVDKTTFTPLAEFVCDGSDITTSDEDADRRGLALYQCNASSSSPTGTTGTSFTLDNDNAGAGVDQQVMFNRGSTDAEDAAVEWDETNDRFNLLAQDTTGTLAALNALSLLVGGTEVIGSDGDLAAASIATDQLYVFGANGVTPYGVRLTLSGSSGAPSSGTHAAGELAVDSAGLLYICVSGGTPGTWQTVGLQDGGTVVSVGNGSASAANPASCTIQLKDQFGGNKSVQRVLTVYLMDDDDGGTDAANTSSISVTTGTLIRTVTADKVFRAKTDASGTLTFAVTNSIADNVYVLTEPAPGQEAIDCSDHGTLNWT